jgi:hypothetical protein
VPERKHVPQIPKPVQTCFKSASHFCHHAERPQILSRLDSPSTLQQQRRPALALHPSPYLTLCFTYLTRSLPLHSFYASSLLATHRPALPRTTWLSYQQSHFLTHIKPRLRLSPYVDLCLPPRHPQSVPIRLALGPAHLTAANMYPAHQHTSMPPPPAQPRTVAPETFLLDQDAQQSLPADSVVALQQVDNRT